MKNGILIVSLDFELFWGMQDCSTISEYGDHILGGRKAIPRLLKLFHHYGIHSTWATVGFIFADDGNELKNYLPPCDRRPDYDKEELSSYRCIDEMQTESYRKYYYAPDLIHLINRYPETEIGTHTLSHYYCREKGQTTFTFQEDMGAALKLAREKGYELTSVVLPRNQCEPEYTQVLSDMGLKAYRDEENDWIHEKVGFRPLMRVLRLMDVYFPLTGQGGYIPKKENGIWNLTGSRMYKPYFSKLFFLERLKLFRIKRQMLHAAKHGLVFHLWWHPHNVGVRTEFHLKQLKEIFSYYRYLQQKYGMLSMNMGEAADYFEQHQGN